MRITTMILYFGIYIFLCLFACKTAGEDKNAVTEEEFRNWLETVISSENNGKDDQDNKWWEKIKYPGLDETSDYGSGEIDDEASTFTNFLSAVKNTTDISGTDSKSSKSPDKTPKTVTSGEVVRKDLTESIMDEEELIPVENWENSYNRHSEVYEGSLDIKPKSGVTNVSSNKGESVNDIKPIDLKKTSMDERGKSKECLKSFPNARQRLGIEHSGHSEVSCLRLCFDEVDCKAADFDRYYNACRIHYTTSATEHLPDPCCVHHKKVDCSAETGNDAAHDLISEHSIESMTEFKDGECDRLEISMDFTADVSQYGGSKQTDPVKMTEKECIERCLNNTLCSAVDFNKYERSCWIHASDKTGKRRLEKSSCCNHYKKNITCENDCFDVYQYNRVNLIADIRLFGSPLSECKQQCLGEQECMAFTYNSEETECLMFKSTYGFTGKVQSDVCCSLWVKQMCNGHRNDTLVINEIYQPTTTISSTTSETTSATTRSTFITTRMEPPTTTRRTVFDFTEPDQNIPKDVESAASGEGGFWMSTSSIIVIAGCVFVFVVGLIGLIAFAAHRRKERRKLENDILNPTNPKNWIINHRHRDSGGGNLLAFWQSELHQDRRSDTCSHPGRQAASLPPTRAADFELIPIQRSQVQAACVSDPLHLHMPEVTPVKRVANPPSYCTYVRPSTYAESAQLSGVHSPKRLTRYEATSINNNDTLYIEEFGDSDKFYRGGDNDRILRPINVSRNSLSLNKPQDYGY